MTKKNKLPESVKRMFDEIANKHWHAGAGELIDSNAYFNDIKQFLADELARQKDEIMPISQADKDLAKGTEESGIFRVFLNEAINQAIKTIKEI